MKTPEQIVRALAVADPVTDDQGCQFCEADVEGSVVFGREPEPHGSTCPWRLAVEWVRKADTFEADMAATRRLADETLEQMAKRTSRPPTDEEAAAFRGQFVDESLSAIMQPPSWDERVAAAERQIARVRAQGHEVTVEWHAPGEHFDDRVCTVTVVPVKRGDDLPADDEALETKGEWRP